MTTIHDLIAKQRQAYLAELENALSVEESGSALRIAYQERKNLLLKLQQMILEREREVQQALYADLAKSPVEGYMTETGVVLSELSYTLKHLKQWMRPKKVGGSLSTFPGRNYMYPEPYGLTLILSPWNYPFQLCMMPLIGAIAAGNRCVVKPSEQAPATARLVKSMLDKLATPERIATVLGGPEVSTSLLEEKFDYIFFTGSVEVGRKVMLKAAQTLTPLTLELGGKSPCIVERDADLELAAKRIAFGKGINAGQTCVAPDYLLVHERVHEKLLGMIAENWAQFYGDHPLISDDWPKIVNQKHYERLMGLLDNQSIYCGGKGDGQRIAPTLLKDVDWSSSVMQEEIFGPILPVISFKSLDDAIKEINLRERPLACYIFTENEQRAKAIIRSISFGGGCVNDTLVHLSNPRLPFGGVGMSGLGSYHGKHSFDTFTHYKSVLHKGKADFAFRYPPFSEYKGSLLRQFLK